MDARRGDGTRAHAGAGTGLRLVAHLLDLHPGAAVAVVDVGRNLGDARTVLAGLGIDIGEHTMLRGTAAAEFVAPTDVGLVSAAFTDASDHGEATRTVHLRDGRRASLHMIRVDAARLATRRVMVIVPDSDGTFAETPAPITADAAARVGVLYADGTGVITRAEDPLLRMLRQTRAALEGRPMISLAYPADQEVCVVNWVAAKEQRGVARRWRCRVVRGDGSLLWTEVTISNRINDDGEGDVRAEMYDISSEVAAAEALANERSLLKQLTETLPVGVAKFDAAGRIEYANAQLTNLLGRDPATIVSGAIAGEIPVLADAFAQLLREGRPARFVSERMPDQLERDLEWTLRPVTTAAGTVTGGVLCVADVTEATELRAALEERASTDGLTGCLNWAGTINCLQAELRSASREAGVGVLFIDLDGFKGINDAPRSRRR